MSVFKLAAPVAQYYFRFCIWWRHSRRSKFICKPNFLGWVITTSGLKKQTSAILEFFQRLRCRSDYSKLCAIVHQAPNFPPNRTIRDGVITSYTTSRWQPGGALLLYFRFRIYMTQTLLFWRWNLCHPPPPPNVYAIRWQKFCSCWSSSLEWSTVCTPDLAFDRFKPGLKNYLFTLVWWDLSA